WHWGISYGFGRVAEYQRTLGKAAIDAGADLIAGHHAHRLLGIEMYKGKVITHSLGNFAFDRSPRPHFGKETMILKCYVRNKRIQKVTFLPALINEDRQPVVLDAKKGQLVIQLMADASEEFGTSLTVEGNEVVIGAKSAPPEASWLYQATGLHARS
ncbi:MAG: CapA family protein, partial [Chloroflexi bacterium]|nr:CapA family protein [Chloroflexota bacterium]